MHSIKNGDAKKVPTFEIENKREESFFLVLCSGKFYKRGHKYQGRSGDFGNKQVSSFTNIKKRLMKAESPFYKPS